MTCFDALGDELIPAEMVDWDLPQALEPMEKFVCRMYSATGVSTLPALRWKLFSSKNMEGEMLPPTRSSLLPHIMRANYMSMRDKSYVKNFPSLPPIEDCGWVLENGILIPLKCFTLPAPRALIELTKCACKSGCKTGRCSCFKNRLSCTTLCKCQSTDCENDIRADLQVESDEDEENDELY